MKNNKVQLSTEENAKQNPQKGAVMGKRKAKRTTTNCELFSLYPSPDGTFWKWFRFNSQKNRGGKKDIAIIARKAGFIVNEPITNVLDARMYVETAIEKGLLQVPGSDPLGGMKNACNIKLRNFVIRMMDPKEELFNWLQGDPKTKIGIRRFKSYASSFRLHGYDALPENLKLVEATREDIERFIRKMRSSSCSDDIVSNCFQSVRKAYLYAIKELKIVREDPTEGIKITYTSNSERDLLRPYELIDLLENLKQKAESTEPSKRNYAKSIYVAVKLMIHTGMREGEVRALRISKVERLLSDQREPTKIFRIRVDSSWEEMTQSLKPPKNGKSRDVFIWDDLAELLFDLYKENKSPKGFIFCCLTNTSIPLTKNNFTDYVYPALREIGIPEEKRLERKITMHSFRHFFITRAEAISSYQWHKEIMETTGHETETAHSVYMQYNFLAAYYMARLSRDLLKEDNLKEIYKDAIVEAGTPLFDMKEE